MKKWLVILVAAFAVAASAADITGTWKASMETPNGAMETTYVFKVDGAKLTGTVSSPMGGDTAISEGKVEGDNVTFTVAMSFNGNDFKMGYTGKVTGNEMKLTMSIPSMDRTFELTAKKVN